MSTLGTAEGKTVPSRAKQCQAGQQGRDGGSMLRLPCLWRVQVVCVMAFQIGMAYWVSSLPWWKVLLAAYVISGVANQNLLTAQHELSHFLAFRTPFHNRVLSLLSNCPIAVPMATAFRKYHQEHHSHLVRPSGSPACPGNGPCGTYAANRICLLKVASSPPEGIKSKACCIPQLTQLVCILHQAECFLDAWAPSAQPWPQGSRC